MDSWEQKELDAQTPEQVALELFKARKELEENQSERDTASMQISTLKRQIDALEKQYENKAYSAKMQDRRVRELEQYLTKRI